MAIAHELDWSAHALHELGRAGYRAGNARTTVVRMLGRQRCCLSARELHELLSVDGSAVGVASVYRALELLDELRLVRRVDAGEGVVRYEPALPSGEHHHHVVCDRCGAVTSFEDERLETAIRGIARRLDHSIEGHEVVLRGACPRCRG